MKNNLNLHFSQHFIMTPQLRHSIKLLQLSNHELLLELQKFLDTNPMLELKEDFDFSSEYNISCESQSKNEFFNNNDYITTNYHVGKTLQDHLLWQLELSQLSDIEMEIGKIIINSIDDKGYFIGEIEEICNLAGKDNQLDISQVKNVLLYIQSFEPIGVGARNLEECLLIQLKTFYNKNFYVIKARQLILNFLNLLAEKKYTKLENKLKISRGDLEKVISIIRNLNPNPGYSISNVEVNNNYIYPDCIVEKKNNSWSVRLTKTYSNSIKINKNYESILKEEKDQNQLKILRDQLTEAKWLLKSLDNRNNTLLKVVKCIVELQQEFFEQGPGKLKPLTLQDIAKSINMHESTISRTINQKYILTPRGICKLKYFFSNNVNSIKGKSISSKTIQEQIKSIIKEEDKEKPLSDKKIAHILSENDILVSRRTVSKYRETLGILSSNRRKRA